MINSKMLKLFTLALYYQIYTCYAQHLNFGSLYIPGSSIKNIQQNGNKIEPFYPYLRPDYLLQPEVDSDPDPYPVESLEPYRDPVSGAPNDKILPLVAVPENPVYRTSGDQNLPMVPIPENGFYLKELLRLPVLAHQIPSTPQQPAVVRGRTPICDEDSNCYPDDVHRNPAIDAIDLDNVIVLGFIASLSAFIASLCFALGVMILYFRAARRRRDRQERERHQEVKTEDYDWNTYTVSNMPQQGVIYGKMPTVATLEYGTIW